MSKTQKNYYFLFVGLALASIALMVVVIYNLPTASANPSVFNQDSGTNGCVTAAATTTLSHMTPGAATTTLNCALKGDDYAANKAYLIVISNASSSPDTAFRVDLEFSHDSTTGTDGTWFADFIDAKGTTTPSGVRNLNVANAFVWGNVASTSSNFRTKIFEIPVPTKYMRAVISIPVGTVNLNGAVWAKIVTQKELR